MPPQESSTQDQSLFSLLSQSKPQASHSDNYGYSNYNENFNYAYNSVDTADDVLTIEESFENEKPYTLIDRLGAALPSVPSYEKTSIVDFEPR